jgi:hypothetical protein
MKIKNLKPSEMMTTRDFPVHNPHILKIYFRICEKGHENILPPTPVIPFSAGLPLLPKEGKKSKDYNNKLQEFLKKNKRVKYLMVDGSHKTTALTLTHKPIHVVVLSTDNDIQEVKELVGLGDVFSLEAKDTIEQELIAMANHLKPAKFFETVEDKTKRMVKEKVIPDYMIKYYKKMVR